ncbi:haloacid dehalogenase type II [Pontibacillus halophilus]
MSIKAFVFDAYGTLFDVHSVKEKLEEQYPLKGEAISEAWRSRQVHYFMVRQLIHNYASFEEVTSWALQDALQVNGVTYNEEQVEQFMSVYEHLHPFEEVKDVLHQLQDHQLVVFTNGTQALSRPLLKNNGLDDMLRLLTADEQGIYKPDPMAYDYALKELGVEKEEVLFMSSNPWDITGAKSFGFQTAWIRRGKGEFPKLGFVPDYIYEDLTGILAFK